MNSDVFPYSKPKKILLIEPPFYRFFNYQRFYYPVTLTLVASYLEKMGHEVRIYDADKPTDECKPLSRIEVRNNYHLYEKALNNKKHPIWSDIYDTLKECRPDIVGLTSITAKMDSTDIVAGIARELFGNKIKIILGGSHAEAMKSMPDDRSFNFDYDEKITYIPNLIEQTPNKKLIINYEQYSPKNLASMLTSMGCPNECTFCCHSFEKKITYRNIQSVREELKDIRDSFGTSVPVSIMDDCFLSNTSHFNEISWIFRELGLKFTTGARIMSLTPQKVDNFVQCGGIHISVGVESGSQRILDRIKKRLQVEEIKKRTKFLNGSGLSWSAFLMVGFPFETMEDLKLTEELVYEIKPTFISINRFTPYPGTEIYKEYFRNAEIKFKDLFQLNSYSCVRLPDDMEKYIDSLFDSFDEYNEKNLKNNRFMKTAAESVTD